MPRDRIEPEVSAENIQLASKFDAVELEIEKLRLTLTQKEVTVKARVTTTVEPQKQVKSLESKNGLLLQTDVKFLYCLRLVKKILSGAKKSLVGSAPNKFNGIALKLEVAVCKWRGKEASELALFKRHIK